MSFGSWRWKILRNCIKIYLVVINLYIGFHPDIFGQDYIFNELNSNDEIQKIHGEWYLWDENGMIWAASSPQNDQIDQPQHISAVLIIPSTVVKCEGTNFGS